MRARATEALREAPRPLAILVAFVLAFSPSARAGEPGDGWSKIRRPLDVPMLAPGEPCDRTLGGRAAPKVAFTLGSGPAYPVLGMSAPPPSPAGVVDLSDDVLRAGWYWHKTLWAFSAREQGPILIRGARIDRSGRLRFGLGFKVRPELRMPAPHSREWRYGVSSTLLPGPGCFAFQVDGRTFSQVIVFRATLVRRETGVPRLPEPVPLMATPSVPLAKCRSSRVLRPACPLRIPRVPGWRTYGAPRVKYVFGIERGGEYPGQPRRNRPPAMAHVEVWGGRVGQVPVVLTDEWPTGSPSRLRNGLLRRERKRAILLGQVRWGGRAGELALAPGYPVGGSLGNHLVFRWMRAGKEYLVSLHAWEPFLEAASTLRAVVESLPP